MCGGGCNRKRDNDKNADSWVDNSLQDLNSSLQEAREWSNLTLDRLNSFVSTDAGIPATLGSVGKTLGFPSAAWNSLGAKYQAYPVPSAKQFAQCREQNGESVWTEDGVWRCLFRNSPAYADFPTNSQKFTDYAGFLDWQSRVLKQRADEDRAKRAAAAATAASSDNKLALNDTSGLTSLFPGAGRPRLISEDDAKGKNLVSSDIRSETVTLDDGSLETRQQEIRYFDDNTATMTKTKSSSKKDESGWFWK